VYAPLRLTPLAASIFLAFAAHAQTADQAPERPAPQNSATLLPTVTVNASADASAAGLPPAYAGGQVASGGRVGFMGNQDIMETPFTSTSYTLDLIQNQQARSVSDVVQNDPSVRTARGFGNFQELYVIRGFPVYSDDMAYNGLYGILPRQYVAAELLERVEVFRGANTFLNGAAPGGSGIGGAINLVPKRASNEDLTQVTAGVDSGGQAYLATDLARRFGPDQSTGLRVNAVRRDGGTAVDDEKHALSMFSVGLDYRQSDVRLSADLGYQNNQLDQPRPSVTASGGIPPAPDAAKNFAQSWTYSDERQTFGTLRGEYDINDKVTAWAAVGMRQGKESNVLANPTATANGSTSAYRFDNEHEDSVKTGEIGIRGKIRTGSVGHSLSAVADAYALDSKNAYAMSSFSGFPGSLYDPVAVAAPSANFFTGGSLSSPKTTEKTETTSVALADTLSLADDRVLVTLGARHQTIANHSYNYNSGAEESSYKKSRVSPMGGIVFKATAQVSLYSNYIESLAKGDVAPTTSGTTVIANGGEAFAPYVSKQKEVGVKYDGGRIGGVLNAFTTSKPSGYVTGNTYGIDGEQRNRGVELSLYGEPLQGVRLLGGITQLDARQIKTSGGSSDGKDAIGVPHQQVNAGVEWDVPALRGLTLTGRAIHTSAQYADAANTLELPSWSRFDLGARYITSLGKQALTLRARVDNVADRDYWASAGGYPGAGYLVLGAPRSFMLSATVDF
jgi:iron complex outermembrane receptor protein